MPLDIEAILANRTDIDAELQKHKSPVTIMFTDLAGSTSFFEHFGDTAGVAWIEEHNSIVFPEVEERGGTVVKTIGDSVMAYFTDPSRAVIAACAIQKGLLAANAGRDDSTKMNVRVALHQGLGYLRGGDVFGDVVNTAARIAKACLPFQILVSQSVYLASQEAARMPFREVGALQVRGKSQAENTYEVLWTDENTYNGLRQQFPARPQPTTQQGEETGGGRYMVLNELGRGAMGVVYRSFDKVIGRVVALKTIPLEMDASSRTASMERLQQEARTAGLLDHPNIVTVYDVGEEGGLFFFTMQYVEGKTLANLRDEGQMLPIDKAFAAADEICSAIACAHEAGIIHRDLKPSNLMLTNHGIMKVLDFGIAKLGDSGMTKAGVVLGTPSYLAPEQASGRRIDHRADIFSLGAVLYELFTNERAFPGESTTSIIYKVVNDDPLPPRIIEPTLPVGLDSIIMKALAKDPAQRYQTVHELREALQRCRTQIATATTAKLTPLGVAIPPPPAPSADATAAIVPPTSTDKDKDKGGAMVGVFAAIATLLIIVGGLWYMFSGKPKVDKAAIPRPPSEAGETAGPGSTKEVLAKADELQSNGKPESAVAVLQIYLNSHADDNAARLRYAGALGVTKNFDEAVKQYQTVLKNDPENVTAQIGMARVTSWKNDLPEALKLYDEVLKTRPNNYDARVGKAYTLMWMKRTDEARRLFEAAAKQAPNDPDVAEALRKLGASK